MIIAVDGPAAAGKGTVARALAKHLGYHFLDTGSLYRMVGLAVLKAGGDPSDAPAATNAAQALDPRIYRDEELRSEKVGEAASVVAANPGVRAALLDLQRTFAAKQPGTVLDGRDIGTVVCPDADVKLFITASAEIRAKRRMLELTERGEKPGYETVLAGIRSRDELDSRRISAPLVAASDAVTIDTSEMTIEEAVRVAVSVVRSRLSK